MIWLVFGKVCLKIRVVIGRNMLFGLRSCRMLLIMGRVLDVDF